MLVTSGYYKDNTSDSSSAKNLFALPVHAHQSSTPTAEGKTVDRI